LRTPSGPGDVEATTAPTALSALLALQLGGFGTPVVDGGVDALVDLHLAVFLSMNSRTAGTQVMCTHAAGSTSRAMDCPMAIGNRQTVQVLR
jgi:hypothetical protein